MSAPEGREERWAENLFHQLKEFQGSDVPVFLGEPGNNRAVKIVTVEADYVVFENKKGEYLELIPFANLKLLFRRKKE